MNSRSVEQALEKSLKELSDIKFALDASSIVAVTDQAGKITYVNDKFCEISRYSRGELIGQDHRIINSGFHSKEFFRDLWRTISQGKVWKGEICNKAKDGAYYWVDTTIVPFLEVNGKPYQYVSIRNEITQRKKMEEVLKELPQKIIQAQETERARISRDIHDDLGQSLALLKILIQSALNKPKLNKKNLKQWYEKILDHLNSTIEKTRNLAHGLRPSTLEVLGVSTAVQALVDSFKVSHKLRIDLYTDDIDNVTFQGESINFFRIVQEALTNVVKHAKAKKVGISIKVSGENLSLVIEDDGRGYSALKREEREGLGISTMRERAGLLKGSFSLESDKGKGTKIIVNIPIKKKENVG